MSVLLTYELGGPSHLLLTFGLGDSGAVTPTDPGVYRDDAVMEDAGERLRALQVGGVPQFTRVYVGANPDELPHPASASYAVAWVWVDSAEDVEVFPGSSLTERAGLFGVAIEVRDQAPLERARRLALLENLARNALSGQKLAGATYPGSVRLRRQARAYQVNSPSARVVLVGKYRYPVGGNAAADESDRESEWS